MWPERPTARFTAPKPRFMVIRLVTVSRGGVLASTGGNCAAMVRLLNEG